MKKDTSLWPIRWSKRYETTVKKNLATNQNNKKNLIKIKANNVQMYETIIQNSDTRQTCHVEIHMNTLRWRKEFFI